MRHTQEKTNVTKKKIGVLVGQEESWLSAFVEAVGRRGDGVEAELVTLGGTRVDEPCEYEVIVDRISHQIPYYRAFLKAALLAGTKIINNPLWSSAIDDFFTISLAQRLGVSCLRVVALPSHSYRVNPEALGNLVYPIPWDDHIAYLGGFPLILRPVHDNGSCRVYGLESYDDLWGAYHETGIESMMLMEHMECEKYVRCFGIGTDYFIVKYNPHAGWEHRYSEDESYLLKKEQKLVTDMAKKLNGALGYEVSCFDVAFRDGTAYLAGPVNPVPEFSPDTMPASSFEPMMGAMADLAIGFCEGEKQPLSDFSWSTLSRATPARKKAASSKSSSSSTTKKSGSSTSKKSTTKETA